MFSRTFPSCTSERRLASACEKCQDKSRVWRESGGKLEIFYFCDAFKILMMETASRERRKRYCEARCADGDEKGLDVSYNHAL
jgi:hypothetical protein